MNRQPSRLCRRPLPHPPGDTGNRYTQPIWPDRLQGGSPDECGTVEDVLFRRFHSKRIHIIETHRNMYRNIALARFYTLKTFWHAVLER